MKKCLVVLLFVGLTSISFADLVYTFDTDVEGYVNVTHEATNPVGWADVPSVKMDHTAGGWQVEMVKEFTWEAGGGAANQQEAMMAMANDPGATVSFDVMLDGGSFTPGVDTWHQLIIVGNSGGAAGWTQTQLTDEWHNADDATLITHHFDMSFADLGFEAGDEWFQIYLGSNSDSAATVNYYLDNVVITPEPMTLALLGLGGLFLRRRK